MKLTEECPNQSTVTTHGLTITEIKREQKESRLNITGVKRENNHIIIDRSDKRELLRPYKGQRLGFEGVLIEILQPNARNDYTYGLVFASVYAPTVQIELDHVVIRINRGEYNTLNLERYTRYYFTARVTKYYKTVHVLNTPVVQENYMLERINTNKMVQLSTSQLTQPTVYTMNRIQNVLLSKVIKPQHTEEQLLDIVTGLPNDGKVEQFIDQYTDRYRNVTMNKSEIIDALYD